MDEPRRCSSEIAEKFFSNRIHKRFKIEYYRKFKTESLWRPISPLKLHILITENKYLKTFYFRFVNKKLNIISQKEKLIKEIKNKIKGDKVICALSGGVDSSVVALLINKAIKN